ncbi:hypothetical protein CICLE_v10029216mg [Citrus x clementina]|uniref:Phosphoglycerate mutase family protein n=1 Tax=Citrus clementina TaxID=85681 RepID=V4SA35_CITCL|nr:uncharacterized protein LOC18033600 isoform X2 [Citrus x clementina]ESR35685.1 hypothetical protein CICLE_v10029216mg [Citrus x clementina]
MATTPFLRNKYWVLRHGKSIPNEKGLIVSSLENGTRREYQLASEGVDQARLAGELFLKVMEDLRERFFGPSFELLSHDKYPEIWALDEKDPFMRPEGGESVNDVVSRLATAMAAMELEFQGCAILVVSHGDPLQILQTLLNAVKQVTEPNCDNLASRIETVRVHNILSQHRKNALLTGELRSVVQ